MSWVISKSVFVVFLAVHIHLQAFVNPSTYVGCFKDDFENGFDFMPGDYESIRLTPLTCMHVCSSRHKYAAIKRESACFCGNEPNVTLKVNDSYCNAPCKKPCDHHVIGGCGETLHHRVYEIKKGILGLVLEVSKKISLLTTTWFTATVLEGKEVEFRFEIDDEIVAPFSKSSSVAYIFRKQGKHSVSVSVRDRFLNIASVAKMVKVIDTYEDVEMQCPALAQPGKEITCKGEWRRQAGSVKFDFGDGFSENVLYDSPLDQVGPAINQSQELSKETNRTLGTFVSVSAVVPGYGQISHWELLVSKPGKIKVQVFRPYRAVGNQSCENQTCSSNISYCYDCEKLSCSLGQSLCLPRMQCLPADSGQRASYNCPGEAENTTSPETDYELVAEDTLDIPISGYHVFRIPRSKQFNVSRLDVIGWSSEGGQLSYTNNSTERNHIFEYPAIVHPGAKVLRNSLPKMHLTGHALCAYVRQPMKFELRHIYSSPGVFKIHSTITRRMSVSVNKPMKSFGIISPRLSSTNVTILLQTGHHDGTSVVYQWDFGDGFRVNSSNSSVIHSYHHSGRFTIDLFATNVVSNHSVSAVVEVLDPIKGCHFSQPIRAVVVGEPSFLKWQCSSGSNVTFGVSLGDGSMKKILKTGSDELIIGNEFSHVYTSAGIFLVTILASSPVGPNISLNSQALVEVAISGIQVRLLFPPHSPTLYVATATDVILERVLRRGTHAICEFDFGDSSLPVVSSRSKVNHTYHAPGTYHVNVTCYNHVSSVWSELGSTIIVETAVLLKNISLSVVPAVLGTPSVFDLRINRGNLFLCTWDFGDGSASTTSFPLTTVAVNHTYNEPGTYAVNVTCRNVVGDSSAVVVADVDEPIRDATIVHERPYARVNQTIEILLTWAGSRVRCGINCEDNSWNACVVATDVTMATIKHVYTKPGKYPVVAWLWNSVSSRNVSERSIIVQNPVKGLQLFTITPSRCPSLSIVVGLNFSANIPPPTNASVFFNFGDGSRRYFKNLDFSQNVFLEKHRYRHPGLFNLTVNVTNQVSNQFFMVSVDLSSSKGMSILYHNGSEFQRGLGSNDQYFPTSRTVRFKLEENSDDVKFVWKIENKSLGETEKGEMRHTFVKPGCFNVTAAIKSLTLSEVCSSFICVEEEIENITLNVKSPTYFNDPTVFTFFTENTASCFALDLGDNTTVRFGHTTCGFAHQSLATYQHLYEAQGTYAVRLLGWNHVSSIERSLQIAISEEACPNPKIHIAGGGAEDRPLLVSSSEEIVLEPIVQQRCHVAKTMIIKWAVFAVNSTETGHRGWRIKLRSARREIAIFGNTTAQSLRSERLSMLVRDLPTELLKVELSVSFIGTYRDLGHVSVSDNTWLMVTRPPLIARIKGGHSRSVPWKSLFVLDGRKSYDPEKTFDSTSLTFSWSCYPRNTSIIGKSKANFGTPSKCFKNSNVILSNSSVIELSTADLFNYEVFVFGLEVKEGTRKSVFQQIVFVIDGPVPSMDLNCVVNCKETVNPTQRLVLESECLSCDKNTRLIYKWSIFICSSLNNTGTLTCTEIPNFGQNTSTDLDVANLATLPNVFKVGTTYKVRCNARMSGIYHSGFVEYLLKVNSPPSGGECTVTPKEGFVLETKFNIRCVGWYDEDRPLTYLVEVKNNQDTMYLTSHSQPNMTLFLPSGKEEKNFTLQVIVNVVDAMLFSTSNVCAVKVFHPRSLDYRQVVEDIQEAIDKGQNNVVIGMVISLCSLLNDKFNWSEQNITELTEIRLNIARILSEMNVTGFDEMRGMSDTFLALTAKPDEVNFETQREVTTSLQNKLSVLHRLSAMSRDIVAIGTTFHKVTSNIIEAALSRSAVNTTKVPVDDAKVVNETTRTHYEDNLKESNADNIEEVLLTLDKINRVLLSQVVTNDQPTVIRTTNYDVHLTRQNVEDLTTDSGIPRNLQVKLENVPSLLENTNLTMQSVLGLMVADLSKTPDIYGFTTDNAEVNSNILRLGLNNDDGLSVDLGMVDVGIFAERKLNHLVEETLEINTLSSWKTIKIHKFNRSIEDTALVVEVTPLDSMLKLRALLSIGQRPTFENYEFQTQFPWTNTTNGDSPYTWVLSRDLLRNLSSLHSQRYFLGVTTFDKGIGVNVNYTLRVFWAKCLMLDEGIWKSSRCKVGSRTAYRHTHCICRPGQAEASENTAQSSSLPRDIQKSRLPRAVKTKPFTRKGTFKISIGAGIFPAPNKIDFHLVFDKNLNDNPLALVTVTTAFGIFLILLIYARRQDKNDAEKVGVAPLPDNDPSDKYFYEISVYTGCGFGAGTTANVSIILRGDKSELLSRVLWHPDRQCFQRGAIDTFLVSSADSVGEINYIQIWHDNSGFNPAWFLNKVIVRDLNEQKSYLFSNDTWLAVEKGLETVRAALFPVNHPEMIGFKRRFKTTSQRNLKDNHLWFSVFARPTNSCFTRVQRLSCCLTLLYCSMLANAMFYREGSTTSLESTVTIGPFRFGVKEIGVGVISALVIFPVNVVIVWIFRNVEPKPSKEDMKAMQESSKIWWFYELFFCCFKSRDSRTGLMKIVSQSSSNNEDSSVDLNSGYDNAMVSSSSHDLFEDINVEVELVDEPMKVNEKRRKISCVLSYWYIYLGWLGLCLTSIVCAFFVVLYGLQFGKDVTARWISSMTITFIQDVIISEPLKVFAIAVVVAVLCKKREHFESEEEREIKSRDYQEWDFIKKERSVKSPSFTEKLLKPLDQKEVEKARAKRLKELRSWSLLKELGLYVLFLLCLSTVTYRNKNPMSFEINKTMKDLFVFGADGKEKSFEQISDVDDLFAWVNDTLLEGLYSSSSWYNHQWSPKRAGPTANLYVIGQVRLRQTRVKQNSCSVPRYFRETITECHGWSSGDNRDTSCYDVNWSPKTNATHCSPSSSLDPWQFYSPPTETTEQSMMSSKDGGFIVDLKRSNRTKNHETVAFLKAHNWLDARTRVIFVEVNIYSAPLNLFCLGQFTVRLLPTNGMTKEARFLVTKLFALSGVLDPLSVFTRVFVFIFFFIFVYREAKQVRRLKRRYFVDFWSVVQCVIVLFFLMSIVVFFVRLAMIEHLLISLERNGELFITFENVAFVDMLLAHLVAIVVFFSWIRVIKLLRFNQRLLFLQETLKKAAKPLAAFSVVFLTFFLAYAHFGYLIFARELYRFRDIPSTFVSLCSLFMGHFDFPAVEGANRILGPVFLFSAVFFGVYIIMNFSIALILDSFLIVKADAANLENEYELVEFVVKQLRAWLGITGTRSPGTNSSGRTPCCEITGGRSPNVKFSHFLSKVSATEKRDGSVSERKEKLNISKKKYKSPETAEKRVSDLNYALESLLVEDFAEEVLEYRLLFAAMRLVHFDWLNEVKKKGVCQEQNQATENHTPEVTKNDELLANEQEKVFHDDKPCSMVAFELSIEDSSL